MYKAIMRRCLQSPCNPATTDEAPTSRRDVQSKLVIALLAAAAAPLVAATAVFAGDAASGSSQRQAAGQQTAQERQHRGVGIVKRVAREFGTVLIAHDPVPSLDWPEMTMTFAIRDDRLLDAVEKGDHVEFEFIQSGDGYAITAIRWP